MGKLEAIFLTNATQDGHNGLYAGLLFQGKKHAVNGVAGCGGEDAIGVTSIARSILQMDLGDILGGVYRLTCLNQSNS